MYKAGIHRLRSGNATDAAKRPTSASPPPPPLPSSPPPPPPPLPPSPPPPPSTSTSSSSLSQASVLTHSPTQQTIRKYCTIK